MITSRRQRFPRRYRNKTTTTTTTKQNQKEFLLASVTERFNCAYPYLAHMYISDIFGFYFFLFLFCFLFLTLYSSSLQGSRPKGWKSVVPFVMLLLLLSVVLHLPKFPQPSCSIDIIRRLFGFPVTLN